MKVGPPVPAAESLGCTYSPRAGLDGDFCGHQATLHALIDAGVEDDGAPSSVFACAEHVATAIALAFTSHEIGGDCGMPGSVMHWETDVTGSVRSWCSYPDEDPTLTASLYTSLPAEVAS